jgi:hypothetical protein
MAVDGCNQARVFVDVGISLELIIALVAAGLNHTGEVILEEPKEAKVGPLAQGRGRHQHWPWRAELIPTTVGCNQGRVIDKRKNTMVYHGSRVVATCPPTCMQWTEPGPCDESAYKSCTGHGAIGAGHRLTLAVNTKLTSCHIPMQNL